MAINHSGSNCLSTVLSRTHCWHFTRPAGWVCRSLSWSLCCWCLSALIHVYWLFMPLHVVLTSLCTLPCCSAAVVSVLRLSIFHPCVGRAGLCECCISFKQTAPLRLRLHSLAAQVVHIPKSFWQTQDERMWQELYVWSRRTVFLWNQGWSFLTFSFETGRPGLRKPWARIRSAQPS